jgi:hypothetical protein
MKVELQGGDVADVPVAEGGARGTLSFAADGVLDAAGALSLAACGATTLTVRVEVLVRPALSNTTYSII